MPIAQIDLYQGAHASPRSAVIALVMADDANGEVWRMARQEHVRRQTRTFISSQDIARGEVPIYPAHELLASRYSNFWRADLNKFQLTKLKSF